MQGGDLFKPHKPLLNALSRSKAKIPRRTKERAKNEEYYSVQAHKFFDESVENKNNICFFCDKEVKIFQGLHHLKGRVGNYLLDKLWWVVVHNECHVENYHQSNAEQRIKQVWWKGFLGRLRLKSEDLYQKEIKKIEKAGLLFED